MRKDLGSMPMFDLDARLRAWWEDDRLFVLLPNENNEMVVLRLTRRSLNQLAAFLLATGKAADRSR